MPKSKVAITIDPALLAQIDALVAAGEFLNRSQAVEAALVDALARRARARLASECAKLDAHEERILAEEGIELEVETWPEY